MVQALGVLYSRASLRQQLLLTKDHAFSEGAEELLTGLVLRLLRAGLRACRHQE